MFLVQYNTAFLQNSGFANLLCKMHSLCWVALGSPSATAEGQSQRAEEC